MSQMSQLDPAPPQKNKKTIQWSSNHILFICTKPDYTAVYFNESYAYKTVYTSQCGVRSQELL